MIVQLNPLELPDQDTFLQKSSPMEKDTRNLKYKLGWKIDRSLPVSITEQIKGQIIYAISFGSLQGGDILPSIRELAKILKVSPVTISKVYRELTMEGLLITKPYLGVFVNEIGFDHPKNQLNTAQFSLHRILENAIKGAELMGYSKDEIKSVFLAVIDEMQAKEDKKLILVVSNYANSTSFYAQKIAEMLNDLNVEVLPMTISELTHNFDANKDLLRKASLVVTIPARLQEIRALLEAEYCRVVTVAFELAPTTIQRLSAIRPEQRVGIVSTLPDYVQTMVNELESYGLNITPPLTATINQTDRIKEMLKQIDVLIYASGSEKVAEWVPEHVQSFEFLHSPKAESVNRLRAIL